MAVFSGTPGNDLSVGGNWSDMYGLAGNDKLNDTGDDAGVVDDIFGNEGDDYLYFSGTATGFISGLEGHDFVKGVAGADSLFGGEGNDVVLGQGGDDEIGGDAGIDLLVGGEGDDTIDGGEGDDGSSIDVVAASATTYQNNTLASYGDAGIFGGAGDDYLSGDQGNDRLEGEAGKDFLLGGGLDDALHGGEGNDRIKGGPGSDDIFGGPGRDVMEGSTGADRFYFQDVSDSGKGRAADKIVQFKFKQGKDKIDLTAIDAREGGADDAFKYTGSDPFTGKKGQLRSDSFGNESHKVTGDMDGDGGADFMIKVFGVVKLAAHDFVL